jgi:hypothetical protein
MAGFLKKIIGVQSLMLRDTTPSILKWNSTFRNFLHAAKAGSMFAPLLNRYGIPHNSASFLKRS